MKKTLSARSTSPDLVRAALLLMVSALLLAGCSAKPRDGTYPESAVGTADYDGPFNATRVGDAARALGWPLQDDAAPVGLPGRALVLGAPNITLHAMPNGSAAWRIVAMQSFGDPFDDRDARCDERYIAQHATALQENMTAALDAFESQATVQRTALTWSCIVTTVISD